jgi:predicted nucleic acid-binding protein
VSEPESALVERFLRSGVRALCSSLTQAEMASVLHRKAREGASKESLADIWDAFQRDLSTSAFVPVETSAEDVRDAIALIREHGARALLRTLDAIHLSTARNLGANSFLTFDHRQRETAIALGFELPSLG